MSLKSTLMALSFTAAASVFGGNAAHAQDAQTAESTQPTVVKVQPGDTLSSIAEAHDTDYVRLFNANERITNPDVINVDDEVRVPRSDEELPDRYAEYTAANQPVVAETTATQVAAPVAAAQPVAAATPAPAPAPVRTAPVAYNSAGNTYAYGWCTWYVKSRKPNIPNSLGNAHQWIGSAQSLGYATGSTPVAGAIGAAGNHVVYVESTDGVNVTISEMAYAGGVGVVHYRTVPANSFYYIYA